MSEDNDMYKDFKQLSRPSDNESNYEKAMKILKTGNLMFMAGIKDGQDEKVLTNNLEETVNSYRNIMDSRDKLDNFAREFLEFQKSLPEKFSIQNIESGLTDPAKYIKVSECKGQYETCKKNELTKSELEELFDSPEFKPKFRDPEEFLEDQSDYKSFPTTQHLFQPNASIKSSNSNVSSNNPKLAALSEALFRKPKSSGSGDPKKIVPEIQNTSASNHNTNKPHTVTSNPNNTEKEDSEPVNKYPDFMNSKEVLKIQNYKKYGDPNYISVSSSNNNTKKTLGGKRLGVNKPFVAPFASDNNGKNEKSVNMETEEVTNEHLKNIDPKMIELIKNEIMDTFTPVTWDDIAGLNYAKGIINEAVILPILRPDLFKGLRNPPKGILLFGPPGTGKTLIGKCIASQSKSTFFNISASSLTSKWIGEGEKMVRALFAVARAHQPAVVFIDEIDSLLCQRSETEHESSRRLKTEFLVQFDGANTGDDDRILIVAATNRPQELDEAARRRFTKKLYIPLPEFAARVQIIKNLLQKESHQLSQSDIQEIGKLTDGFSGADMKILCQEASMFPIRQIAFSQISSITPSDVRPINCQDFKDALEGVRASVSKEDLGQYEKWDRTFGSGKNEEGQRLQQITYNFQ